MFALAKMLLTYETPAFVYIQLPIIGEMAKYMQIKYCGSNDS